MMSRLEAPILLVDDQSDARAALAELLTLHGYSSREATNGRQALDLLFTGFIPSLVVIDLLMGPIDGIELCLELQALPQFAAIPRIVTSAALEHESVKGQLPRCGAVAVLAKPFTGPSFIAAVQKALGQGL